LIAGNVYDYGAQAFIKKQEQGQLSQFIQALNTVEGIGGISFHSMNYIFLFLYISR
jgi:hypothetical protein